MHLQTPCNQPCVHHRSALVPCHVQRAEPSKRSCKVCCQASTQALQPAGHGWEQLWPEEMEGSRPAAPTSCKARQAATCSRRELMTSAAATAITGGLLLPAFSCAAEPVAGIQAAYDSYAPTYDELDGGGAASALGFDALRGQLLAAARGQVVEVAVGTGLNLPYYKWGPDGVRSVLALDLSEGMLTQAQARVAASRELAGKDISFQQVDATVLPLPDNSADCVVDTFSLCVIPDPLAALQQMARVVRSEAQGGRVLLLEHTRSDNPFLGAYQDLTADAVAATAKGCVWNQDIPSLVRQAGLIPVRMERHTAGTILLVEAVKRT